jgi:hypothetical protein
MPEAKSDGLYFHIGNSGFTFAVEDHGVGPELIVSAGAFGHGILRSQMLTTKDGLLALGMFLVEQSQREFSAPYCCATEKPQRLNEPGPTLSTDTATA